jgi:hypothetical protein
LKCRICRLTQGATQWEGHPERARGLHALRIFAHQTDAGGEQTFTF